MSEQIEQSKLWIYIALAEFKKPATPIDESIKKRYNTLIKKLFPESKSKEFQASDGLKQLPKGKLNRTTPNPDWYQAIDALDVLLNDWIHDKTENNVFFIVGQPLSKNDEILEKWGAKNDIQIIPTPTFDQILNPSNWIEKNSELLNNKFIIPRLENFFLKHHLGLSMIRDLIDKIDKQNHKCIIGINSWAWIYLNEINIVSHEVSNNVYIAEAFDGEKFKNWIQQLTQKSAKRKFIYRKTNDGSYLIYPESQQIDTTDNNDKKYDDKLFRTICSHSYGIPNVALQIWKASLRSTPDDEFFKHEDTDEKDEVEPEKNGQNIPTIWVLPWEKLSKPIIDRKITKIEEAILYLLLLHNELSLDRIKYILGETFSDHNLYLRNLVTIGLIVKEGSSYRLNAIAYSEISQYLKSEGYLFDNL